MSTEVSVPIPSVVLVTADFAIEAEVARLAAASGVSPIVIVDPVRVLSAWASATCVLVGADQVEMVSELSPPLRTGVRAVAQGPVSEVTVAAAMTMGSTAVDRLDLDSSGLVTALSHTVDAGAADAEVIGVIGGSGGAGASTLACALAQTAGRVADAAIIDCDRFGPGLDRLLGLEQYPGSRWEDLSEPSGRISGSALRAALPREEGCGVLTWTAGAGCEITPAVGREVLAAARRGHATTILDLPRALSRWTAEMLARCDRVILVVNTGLPATAAAGRVRDAIPAGVPVELALRGRHPDLDAVGRLLEATPATRLPSSRRIGEHIDLGLGPLPGTRGAFARTCRKLLDRSAAEACAA